MREPALDRRAMRASSALGPAVRTRRPRRLDDIGPLPTQTYRVFLLDHSRNCRNSASRSVGLRSLRCGVVSVGGLPARRVSDAGGRGRVTEWSSAIGAATRLRTRSDTGGGGVFEPGPALPLPRRESETNCPPSATICP